MGYGKAVVGLRFSVQVLVMYLLFTESHVTGQAYTPGPEWFRPRPRPSTTSSKPRVITTEPTSTVHVPGCEVSMNDDLPYPEPVILDPTVKSQDGFSFKRPSIMDDEGKLAFASGESVRLVCTGPDNRFPSLGVRTHDITATCVTGQDFKYNNTRHQFTDFRCAQNSLSTTQDVVSSSCDGNGLQATRIGFELSQREFVKIIEVCFDSVNLDVLWTRFDLVSEIGQQESGFSRPVKFSDVTFPFRANNFYRRIKQQSTITNIIGKEMAAKYIKLKGDSYLSRGHLVSSLDFLYDVQNRATFNLINAAPQWFLFNEVNWNVVESQTRLYASDNSLNLEVYTGTYGNEKLPDSDGREHDVYLNINRSGRKRIKVPAVFWKAVYEPKGKRAIVLVGVNNQLKNWESVMSTDGVDLCPGKHRTSKIWRICSASNPSHQRSGFGYCCEVKDIRNNVNLPEFTVNGFLQ